MNNLTAEAKAPEIICSDTLGHSVRTIVELSKAYDTVILIYEDDFSEKLLAAWAEKDRLNVQTKKVGEIYSGIEVCSFGLEDFPPGTILELSLREINQDMNRQNVARTLYRSLLNELSLITIKAYQNGRGNPLLQ
jgi:hypothetical protein